VVRLGHSLTTTARSGAAISCRFEEPIRYCGRHGKRRRRDSQLDGVAWLSINRQSCHHLSYVVPTSPNELRSLERILCTCVGDYGAAVAGGVSWVIGVQIGETLIGCIELQPRDGQVLQVLGPRNTPLPPLTLERVLSALEVYGVTPQRTTR